MIPAKSLNKWVFMFELKLDRISRCYSNERVVGLPCDIHKWLFAKLPVIYITECCHGTDFCTAKGFM